MVVWASYRRTGRSPKPKSSLQEALDTGSREGTSAGLLEKAFPDSHSDSCVTISVRPTGLGSSGCAKHCGTVVSAEL